MVCGVPQALGFLKVLTGSDVQPALKISGLEEGFQAEKMRAAGPLRQEMSLCYVFEECQQEGVAQTEASRGFREVTAA